MGIIKDVDNQEQLWKEKHSDCQQHNAQNSQRPEQK
jgi:hypothetical protein